MTNVKWKIEAKLRRSLAFADRKLANGLGCTIWTTIHVTVQKDMSRRREVSSGMEKWNPVT